MGFFRDLFERKETNQGVESQVISTILELYGGMPAYSDVNYKTMAEEGYTNFVIFSSLNHIVNGFNQLEFKVVKVDKDGNEEDVPNHPLTTLLKRPNPFQGKGSFNEAMIKYYYIGGETFIQKVEAGGRVKELYALRPDETEIDFGTQASNPITSFKYGASKKEIEPQDILHLKCFNPVDKYIGLGRGQSRFTSVAKVTDTINAAMAWNFAVMKNGGRPSGAFVSEGTLTDPQYERLKTQSKEKIEGEKNAGRTLILEGGVTWQEMFINQKDADWVEGQKLNMRQISVGMGVPSILNGDTESTTYSNYKEARKALYQDNIIPLGDYIVEEYNIFFSDDLAENEMIVYSTENVVALQEEVSAVFDRATKANTPLTENEKRQMIDLDTIDGLDVVITDKYMYDTKTKKMYVNMNYVPVEDLGLEPTDGNPDEEE